MADPLPNEGKPADPVQETPLVPPAEAKKKRRKKPKNVEYYELLQVEWTATDKELNKAYKKRALRLHPDKGGDAAEFARMKKAYDILSDEKKREMYDKYGPEMLRVMEGEAGPDLYIRIMLEQSRSLRLGLAALVLVLAGLILLFPILHSVRWDGAPWSWAIIFVPAWVFQAVAWTGYLFAVLSRGGGHVDVPEGAENEQPARQPLKSAQIISLVVNSLLFAMAYIFQAFLAVKLDGTVSFSWFGVVAPWLFFEVVVVFKRLNEAAAEAQTARENLKKHIDMFEEMANTDPEAAETDELKINLARLKEELGSIRVARSYALYASFWPAMRFATALLLAARAQGNFTGTYFLTAIPIMVGVVIMAFLEAVGRAPDDGTFVGTFLGSIVGAAPWLLVWLLGMAKLDNKNIYSGFAVYGDVFIIVGVVACTLACIIVCAPGLLSGAGGEPNAGAAAQQDEQAASPPPVVPTPPPPAAAASAQATPPTVTAPTPPPPPPANDQLAQT